MHIRMKSERPLYVDGAVVTEFDTDEQHARALEASRQAQRVDGVGGADEAPPVAAPPESPAKPAEPAHEPAGQPAGEPVEPAVDPARTLDPKKSDSEGKKARLGEHKTR